MKFRAVLLLCLLAPLIPRAEPVRTSWPTVAIVDITDRPVSDLLVLRLPQGVRFVPGSIGGGGGGDTSHTFARLSTRMDVGDIARQYAQQASDHGWEIGGMAREAGAAVVHLHGIGASAARQHAVLALWRIAPDVVVGAVQNVTDLSSIADAPVKTVAASQPAKTLSLSPEFALPTLHHPREIASLRASGGGDGNTISHVVYYRTSKPVIDLVNGYAKQLESIGWSIDGRANAASVAAIRLRNPSSLGAETSLLLTAEAIPQASVAIVTVHAAHLTLRQ